MCRKGLTRTTALQSTVLQTVVSHISHSEDALIEQHIFVYDSNQDSFDDLNLDIFGHDRYEIDQYLSRKVGLWILLQSCM